jgi:flagellar protein FliL
MADENDEAEDIEDLDEDEAAPSNKNRKILFIFGGVVALLIIGGSAAFFLGFLDSLLGRPATHAEVELPPPPAPPILYELQKKKADLKTGKCRAPFLQYQITLEVSKDYANEIRDLEPKIVDAFQIFLRDQTREDLSGRAGAENLRHELGNIVNEMIRPHRIEGVIFKQFILQ